MSKPSVADQRREIRFADFQEMLGEAQRLLEGGYESKGNWTLGQATSHIADWMRFPMDGFPKPPFFLAIIFWIMKQTIAPGMKRKILAEGFPPGQPTAPETVADPQQMTDEAGVQKLRDTVQRIETYRGELHPSPLFGPMDLEQLKTVSLLHAAHHLGYLHPA